MKVKLNAWERINLATVIGQRRENTVIDVGMGLELIGILKLNEEEEKLVGFPSREAIEAKKDLQFEVDDEHHFTLEIPENLVKFAKESINTFRGWPVNEQVITLCDKFKL